MTLEEYIYYRNKKYDMPPFEDDSWKQTLQMRPKPEIPWYFNGSDLICDYFTGYTAYVNALDGSWLIVNAGGRNIGGEDSGSVAKAIDEAEAFLLEAAKS